MSNRPLQPESPPSASLAARLKSWWLALGVAFCLLAGLDWLLARLVWLPLYCGLFFFLVAGLLVGGVCFRLARAARPMTKVRIAGGVLFVAFMSTAVTIFWEYQYIAGSIGGPPEFAALRNKAVREAGSSARIDNLATEQFKQQLVNDFSPGGPLGYVRWTIASGEMKLEVESVTENVSIDHRGFAWLIRTIAALILTAVGLWLSFEALQSPGPVSNVLAPGEEYEEID
ncbi:MAG: hypothetical protein MI923_14245 [Phycisphaerales bacterium]|nr:hypothetical protein [Phycisphaerales bacterium]